MTDFLRYEIEATYLRGDSPERFALVLNVRAASIELAGAEVLAMLVHLGGIEPRIIGARRLVEPARQVEFGQVEFVGVPVAGLARLFASDLIDPAGPTA